MKRYSVISTNTTAEVHEQSQLRIEASNLLRDNKEGGVCAQIKLCNTGKVALTSVAIDIFFVDKNGSLVYAVKNYEYNNLSVEPNGSFGQENLIAIPIGDAAHIQVKVVYAKFVDGTEWSVKAEAQKKNKKVLMAIATIAIGVVVVVAAVFGIYSVLRNKALREQYDNAMNLYNTGAYEEAAPLFLEINDYKESAQMYDLCKDEIAKQKALEEEQRFLESLLGVYECTSHYVSSSEGVKTAAEIDKEANKTLEEANEILGIQTSNRIRTDCVGQKVEIVAASTNGIQFNVPATNIQNIPDMEWKYCSDEKCFIAEYEEIVPLPSSNTQLVSLVNYRLSSNGILTIESIIDEERSDPMFRGSGVTTIIFSKVE